MPEFQSCHLPLNVSVQGLGTIPSETRTALRHDAFLCSTSRPIPQTPRGSSSHIQSGLLRIRNEVQRGTWPAMPKSDESFAPIIGFREVSRVRTSPRTKIRAWSPPNGLEIAECRVHSAQKSTASSSEMVSISASPTELNVFCHDVSSSLPVSTPPLFWLFRTIRMFLGGFLRCVSYRRIAYGRIPAFTAYLVPLAFLEVRSASSCWSALVLVLLGDSLPVRGV